VPNFLSLDEVLVCHPVIVSPIQISASTTNRDTSSHASSAFVWDLIRLLFTCALILEPDQAPSLRSCVHGGADHTAGVPFRGYCVHSRSTWNLNQDPVLRSCIHGGADQQAGIPLRGRHLLGHPNQLHAGRRLGLACFGCQHPVPRVCATLVSGEYSCVSEARSASLVFMLAIQERSRASGALQSTSPPLLLHARKRHGTQCWIHVNVFIFTGRTGPVLLAPEIALQHATEKG
jgi:hypothetical protein